MIQLKSYPISTNITLTSQVLENYINSFWVDIFSNIKDSHLMLMCKVQFTDESMGYRTLGHLVITNFEDKELFIEYLSLRLGILNESYMVHPISNIIFSYVIKSGKNTESNRTLIHQTSSDKGFKHNFNNMNLPISMIPSDYGQIVVDNYIQVDGESIHRFIVVNGNRTYQIDISKDGLVNKVTILGGINLSWVDTSIDKTNNIFMRVIKKSTIYFMDGQIVLRKQILNAKPFNSLKIDQDRGSGNFFTLDIETIKQNGKLNPYLICAYNGIDYITSFGSDQNTLFKSFMDQLVSKIVKGKTTLIYAHNLSSFDGVFMLKHLIAYCQSSVCEFGKVEPLIFHGKIISIKVKIGTGKNQKTIIFKDSYLLLPLSLRNLCKAFDVTASKGYFPFLLNNIYYSGVLPALQFWTKLSPSIYESLVTEYKGKRMWNFQTEATKYCKLDCQSLYEILTKFNELIYNEFKINSHTVLTLPSLAMKIYKTHYMPNYHSLNQYSIYQLHGLPEYNIRKSYTGGAVDVYIPQYKDNGLLYSYDVNSLYPSLMLNNPMPVGEPIAFLGNIRAVDVNAFGFFYCKITSPEYLEHPILQRSIKTPNAITTVAGLGSWDGWIFSEEMDNAVKYGYHFEIVKGYHFEKGYIFKDYINQMYSLRLQYPKGTAMNLNAKLLMNSLYGKFGMDPETTKVEILANKDYNKYLDKFNTSITDIIHLENHVVLITNTNEFNPNTDTPFTELDVTHKMDVNVAIASAITAYARIKMSYFKNNPAFKLYYSDTDSAVVDSPLPDFMVGPDLGQLKLEHVITKAVFLAPKVYGLITTAGEQIIKAKGLNKDVIKNINFSDLEYLLQEDSTKLFTQSKAYKSLYDANIDVLNTIYTLKATSNKRQNIYINGIFDHTKPFNFGELTSKSNKD